MTKEFKVGDQVYFGSPNGEKTKGEIVKVNKATYKVNQLEARGTHKSHAIGTVWKVAKTIVWAEKPPQVTRRRRRRSFRDLL